jgi:2'-5' RNA ligase
MPNYSLWLEPTTSTYAPCAKFILDVAHRHPEAPYFPPHVTLVGAFHASDDRRATSIFSSAARAFSSVDGGRRGPRIGLERVECGERRHQCVYIRLVKTEAWRDHFARALEATSGRAATEDAADAFMPHLSLAYGLTRATDREDVRKEAEMMVANEHFDGEEMEFETISLWETDVEDDSCASWRCVKREKLRNT